MSNKTLSIHPPEGVPISFALASIGARFGGQLIDILLTYGGLILFFWLMIFTGIWDWSFLAALFLLLSFLVRTPYYIFSELVWNGRTLGKRITKTRVISADGKRLSAYQIVVRNLMKEVEVFMPIAVLFGGDLIGSESKAFMTFWMIAVLCVPLFSKRNQRLGDMIAGTLVVDQPATVLLPDLAVQNPSDRVDFTFTPEQLGIYGRFELQTLEQILREPPHTQEATDRLDAVARTIAEKIGFEGQVSPADHWDFLSDFYRQQREFLESRHLFGDTRENKFHARKSENPAAKARPNSDHRP